MYHLPYLLEGLFGERQVRNGTYVIIVTVTSYLLGLFGGRQVWCGTYVINSSYLLEGLFGERQVRYSTYVINVPTCYLLEASTQVYDVGTKQDISKEAKRFSK